MSIPDKSGGRPDKCNDNVSDVVKQYQVDGYPPLGVNQETIPDALKTGCKWAGWIAEPRKGHPGKFHKAPRNAKGYRVSVKEPEKWLTFDQAWTAYQTGRFSGIGVLMDGSIVGLDVDEKQAAFEEHPELKPLLRRAVEAGVYCEKSPSGKGYRLFVLGDLPSDAPKRRGHLEIYQDVRFLTVTRHGQGEVKEGQWLIDEYVALIRGSESAQMGGNVVPIRGAANAPALSPDELAAKVETIAEKVAETRAQLWEGDLEGAAGGAFSAGVVKDYSGRRSEADLALACETIRQANKVGVPDAQMVEVADTVCRRSGLVRGKWNDPRGDTTLLGYNIAKAIEAVDREPTAAGDETSEWPDPIPVEFGLPDVPPFDLSTLPSAVRRYVEDGADRMSVPADYIAAPLIVAMAAALGNRVLIAPKQRDVGWLVTPNLWGAIVGRPGVMKSPSIDYAIAPLKVLETQLDQSNQTRRKQYTIDKAQYEAALKAFKSQIAKGGPATVQQVPVEPDPPRDERLIVNDTTVAKLGDIAVGSPKGLCVIRDELIGLLATLGAEGHEGDREFYLTAWNGNAEYKIDRIERGSLVVPNLTVSMLGGIQPSKLNSYVQSATRSDNSDDGLLQRFQMVVFPDIKGTWKNVDRLPDIQAFNDAQQAFERLWKVDPVSIGAQTDINHSKYWLHFTTDAQELFDKWRDRFEAGLRKGERHPALESHFAKYRSLVPSLALIFHLADGGTGPVTAQPLAMAIKLTAYLKRHALRIYAGALSSAELAAQALSAKIAQGKLNDEFTIGDVIRAKWGNVNEREDIEAAVDILTDHGWVRELDTKPTGRGRPKRRYCINPKARHREDGELKAG